MAKKIKKKCGPPKGIKPKNYEMFRAAAVEHQWMPGHKGKSVKQIKDTQHLKDWISAYDTHVDPTPAPVATLSPGEITEIAAPTLPCPPKIDRRRKIKIPPPIAHADRVQAMLQKLRPSRDRMLDNDPSSLIKNFKG